MHSKRLYISFRSQHNLVIFYNNMFWNRLWCQHAKKVTFCWAQFDFISSEKTKVYIGHGVLKGTAFDRFFEANVFESLSSVLHQWVNRFKTIIPRNRKLKMTVADTEALFPLMTPPFALSYHNGFMVSRLCNGFPLQKA